MATFFPTCPYCGRGDEEKTKLRQLVREMGEILQDKAVDYYKNQAPDSKGEFCCSECHAKVNLHEWIHRKGDWKAPHNGRCLVGVAQELLSRLEVRAIMEEKP